MSLLFHLGPSFYLMSKNGKFLKIFVVRPHSSGTIEKQIEDKVQTHKFKI